MDRRDFIKYGVTALAAGAIIPETRKAHGRVQEKTLNPPGEIDRIALVRRHNLSFTKADVMNVLTVGNGNFAFGMDITGLQTFEAEYNSGIPLSTMSHWGWHDQLNPKGYVPADYPYTRIKDCQGREVPYLMVKHTPELEAEANFLYALTTRINLGKVALLLTHPDGKPVSLGEIENPRQSLDLWTGVAESRFTLDDKPVRVVTCCHGERDQIGVRIESPLISSGNLKALIGYPYASRAWNGNGADWSQPNAYETRMSRNGKNRVDFHCILDATQYDSAVVWKGEAELTPSQPHQYTLASASPVLEFIVAFSPVSLGRELPDYSKTIASSENHWSHYWTKGGVVDLSESRDERWNELERRIVLSQYLIHINSSGELPPQETGLTCNSWYGKFHLEMHWWHAAHFALWGRPELLERSLPFYERILPAAKARAAFQGFKGARWPKSCGPSGYQAPQDIEACLVWQQPHQIMYAELAYQAHPYRYTLELYKDRVFQTAEFLSSFAERAPNSKYYQLGPPIMGAGEVYSDYPHQWNPTFELAYFHWALNIAQLWRERLGLPAEPHWEEVKNHLSPLTVRDGLYVESETDPHTFDTPGQAVSHPCLVAPLGILDGAMTNRETMRRTIDQIKTKWNWDTTWGWDYPMLAMTAARLGDPKLALEFLLLKVTKNTYLPNGHNFQGGPLPLYLPGNGGLLYAIALMAAGWRGGPKKHAPGFPDDGSWGVKHEGLSPAL